MAKIPTTLFTDRMRENVSVADVTQGAGVGEAAKGEMFKNLGAIATDWNNKLVTARGELLSDKYDIERADTDRQLKELLRVKSNPDGSVPDRRLVNDPNDTTGQNLIEEDNPIEVGGKKYYGKGRGMNEVYSEVMQDWVKSKADSAPDQYAKTRIQEKVGRNIMMSEVEMNLLTQNRQTAYQKEMFNDIRDTSIRSAADDKLNIDDINMKQTAFANTLLRLQGSVFSPEEVETELQNYKNQLTVSYGRALLEAEKKDMDKIKQFRLYLASDYQFTEQEVKDLDGQSFYKIEGDPVAKQFAEDHPAKVAVLNGELVVKKEFLGDFNEDRQAFEKILPMMRDPLGSKLDPKVRLDLLAQVNQNLRGVEFMNYKETIDAPKNILGAALMGRGFDADQARMQMAKFVELPEDAISIRERAKGIQTIMAAEAADKTLKEIAQYSTLDMAAAKKRMSDNIKGAQNQYANMFPKNRDLFMDYTIEAEIGGIVEKSINDQYAALNKEFKSDKAAYMKKYYPELRSGLQVKNNQEFQNNLSKMLDAQAIRQGSPLALKVMDATEAINYSNVIDSQAAVNPGVAEKVFTDVQRRYGPYFQQAFKEMVDLRVKGAEGVEGEMGEGAKDKDFKKFYPAVYMTDSKQRQDYFKFLGNKDKIETRFKERLDKETQTNVKAKVAKELEGFFASSRNSIFEDGDVKDAYSDMIMLEVMDEYSKGAGSDDPGFFGKFFKDNAVEKVIKRRINSNFDEVQGQFIPKNLGINKDHLETFMDSTRARNGAFDLFSIPLPASFMNMPDKSDTEKRALFNEQLAKKTKWTVGQDGKAVLTFQNDDGQMYFVPDKNKKPIVVDPKRLTTDPELNKLLNWGYSNKTKMKLKAWWKEELE
jgi:hypothetical protein